VTPSSEGHRLPEFRFDRLLKSVSRSFYLTLRLLPKEVRGTLSLAYMLARASDTIADTCTATMETRSALLRGLPEVWRPSLSAPGAEGELLNALPELLVAWKSSPDRQEITDVWKTILEGQIFDLERFNGTGSQPLSPDELNRYTFLVAGCVGEFWTDICFKHVKNYSAAPPAIMRNLGKLFGQGLQLVNILRDRQSDSAIVRTYIPPERFDEEMKIARQHLAAGGTYASAIRSRRLRAACALPFQLGSSTLDLIAKHPEANRVKVPRFRVWIALACALAHPTGVGQLAGAEESPPKL